MRALVVGLLLVLAGCGGSSPGQVTDPDPSQNPGTDGGTPPDNTDGGTPPDNTDGGTPPDNTDGGTPPDNTDGGTPPPYTGTTPGGTDREVVTYVGGAANERFEDVLVLSDGTVLVAGGATSLEWVPAGVARTELSAAGINSASAGRVGFVLHLSADLRTLLRVVHFPLGTVRDVKRLRTTSLPGQPTGDIYLSGTRDAATASEDGYFVARLEGNFVAGAPTGLRWTYDVRCPPRQAGGNPSEYKDLQPWDVGADGKVVFVRGAPYDFQWASMHRLTAGGQLDLVPEWPAHWTEAGGEFDGVASAYTGTSPLKYSAVVLKAGRRGSLRSTTQADYEVKLADGNGRTDRQGRFPDDYYFSGPCPPAPATCPGGPGYTGYKVSDKPTQRVGGVVVDRRNGDLYFGYSTQSVLPGGNPDFEPAVVAMEASGRLKWWSRLYHEQVEDKDGNLVKTSSPDQYVDHMGLDLANNRLVVLARAHGNNVINLWSGNKVAAVPGATSFHHGFTGTNGNIHISWLGKLGLGDGTLQAASWVAEYVDGATNYGAAYTDALLDGWPSHNAGWPDLNTTRVSGMEVDAEGAVYLVAKGRRTVTTSNAYMKMYKQAEGRSAWNYFVRVFTPDLKTLRYSSILRGPWEASVDGGGENVELTGVYPVGGGVLAVGYHKLDTATGQPMAAPLNVASVPSWGASLPEKESGVLAHLRF